MYTLLNICIYRNCKPLYTRNYNTKGKNYPTFRQISFFRLEASHPMQRDRGSNLCSRNRVRLQVRVEEKHLTEIKTQSYLNQGKRNDCVPFTRQSQNLENRNYPQRLSYRLKKKQGGNYSRCMSRFHHHTAEIRSKKTPRITYFAVFMLRSLSS